MNLFLPGKRLVALSTLGLYSRKNSWKFYSCIRSCQKHSSHVWGDCITILAATSVNVPPTCAKWRLRSDCAPAQSDQSFHWPFEDSLHPWLSKIRTVKIMIRLRECAGWSDSSLDARFLPFRLILFMVFYRFSCKFQTTLSYYVSALGWPSLITTNYCSCSVGTRAFHFRSQTAKIYRTPWKHTYIILSPLNPTFI